MLSIKERGGKVTCQTYRGNVTFLSTVLRESKRGSQIVYVCHVPIYVRVVSIGYLGPRGVRAVRRFLEKRKLN